MRVQGMGQNERQRIWDEKKSNGCLKHAIIILCEKKQALHTFFSAIVGWLTGFFDFFYNKLCGFMLVVWVYVCAHQIETCRSPGNVNQWDSWISSFF